VKYTVTLIYRELISEEAQRRLMKHEPAFRLARNDADAGRTELVADVEADSVSEALTTAAVTAAAVVTATVDSAEVLSQQEHIDRLGGPDAVKDAARQMGFSEDQIEAEFA
jgi:hypothetical protein